MRSEKIVRTTIIYFIGSFGSKMLAFFLLPLYTAYLSPEDFGVVDLLISIVPLIGPVFTLQITDSIFRFLFDQKTVEDKGRCISSALFAFLCGMLGFAVLYFPFTWIYGFQYRVTFFLYFLFNYIGLFLQQITRGLNSNVDYSVSGLLSTFIQGVLNVCLIVVYHWGGIAMMVSSIAGSVAISLFLFIRLNLFQFLKVRWIDRQEILQQVRFGLPLIPNQISWWVIGGLGKYILLIYWSEYENGILAVATKFPNLLSTMSAVFQLAWMETAIREYNASDRDSYYSSAISYFIPFILSALSVLLPVTRLYSEYAISSDFADAIAYIPAFYLGAAFNAVAALLGSIYWASKDTKYALTTTGICAAICLAANFALVPSLGIWGVAISNTIAFLALFVIRVPSVNKIVCLSIDWRKCIFPTIVLLSSILAYYINSILMQVIAFIGTGLCFLFINRDVMGSLWRVMMGKIRKNHR